MKPRPLWILALALLTANASAAEVWTDRDGEPITAADTTLQSLVDALPKGRQPGKLTIQRTLQNAAEFALTKSDHGGAIVVLDPRNGNILAIAGRSKDGHPRIREAVIASTPGAAFLPVTLLAGFSQGLSTHTHDCAGSLRIGDYKHAWSCHKRAGHGLLNVSDGLVRSCNTFFYTYGIATGPEALDKMALALGLGQDSGLSLEGESAGVIPGPEFLQKYSKGREKWTDGHSANVAIGQGAVSVTPLQMAVVTAAIAHRGIVHQPRLFLDERVMPRANLFDEGVSATDLETLRRGMWRSVNEEGGNARRARLDTAEVAGRTGTAQVYYDEPRSPNAWFLGFAPYENPRVAVCVMLTRGGSGGHAAAPVAAGIIETALNVP